LQAETRPAFTVSQSPLESWAPVSSQLAHAYRPPQLTTVFAIASRMRTGSRRSARESATAC